MEEWREIAGFPGYEVSDLGNVRCWLPRNLKARRPETPRPLKRQHSRGYAYVMVRCGGRTKRCQVHVLVLEAFVGPRPRGMHARHVHDNTRDNCALSNLAWGTPRENNQDQERHGTKPYGDRVHSAKLTTEQVAEIFCADDGLKAIAAKYGVSKQNVWLIRTGRAWGHATSHLKRGM